MDANLTRLMLDGTSTVGNRIISQHANAVSTIADCVRSTLGPFGMQKLMIDETGEAIISNDGNCILQQLQVDNPIASLVIDLASEQDREVGDGTTSIILIVAELLKSVESLFAQGIPCNVIIRGFKKACREAIKFLTKVQSFNLDTQDSETLLNLAMTSISSKILSENSAYFAQMAIDAVRSVKLDNMDVYILDQLSLLKAVGQSIDDSHLLSDCYGFNCTKALDEMPRRVDNARIICIDGSLSSFRAQMGVQVVINDAKSLRDVRDFELAEAQRNIDAIIDANVNVVLVTGKIDDSLCRRLSRHSIMAVRFIKKSDLKCIARTTGASLLTQINSSSSKIDENLLGNARFIEQRFIGQNEALFIHGSAKFRASCLILRGPNESTIDEVARALHDCQCAVKRSLESHRLVAGGAAAEISMAVHLDRMALQVGNKEQIVIQEFANGLRIIARQLALNSGADSTQLLGDLESKHFETQKNSNLSLEDTKPCHFGLNLEKRSIFDCKSNGILDPLMSKVKSLRKITEAVIILAKIDNVIKNNPDKPTNEEEDDH